MELDVLLNFAINFFFEVQKSKNHLEIIFLICCEPSVNNILG